jgi:hypothetical protein
MIRRRLGMRALSLANAVCLVLVLSVDLAASGVGDRNAEAVAAPHEAPSRFTASNRGPCQEAPLEIPRSKTGAARPQERGVALHAVHDERGDDFEAPVLRLIGHRKLLPRRFASSALDEAH